jgi:hypothetical protein
VCTVPFRFRIPYTGCNRFGFEFVHWMQFRIQTPFLVHVCNFDFGLCTPSAAFGTTHAFAVLGFRCRTVLW